MVREVTKEKIIAAGKEMLWQLGIRKVTIEEICARAGVSKMTFYRAFEGKEALARAVFAQNSKVQLEEFLKMKAEASSFKELMTALITMKHKAVDEMSAFLVKDLASPSYQFLMEQLKEDSQKVQEVWKSTLKEAIQNKELRSGVSIALVTYHMKNVQTILRDPTYVAMFSSEAEAMHEAINMFFYGLMGGSE